MSMQIQWVAPDEPAWDVLLSRMAHDAYHLPGYCQLEASRESLQCSGLHVASPQGEAELFIPMLLRQLPQQLGADGKLLDATGPYGYASPIWRIDASDSAQRQVLWNALWASATHALQGRNIVSLFARQNPMLQLHAEPPWGLPTVSAASHISTCEHGNTVYLDLAKPLETLDAESSPSLRYRIRKIERGGYRAIHNDWSQYPAFMALYRQTMSRVAASQMYFFDDAYFQMLKGKLGDNLHFWHVLGPTGDVACGGVFFVCNGIVQYHLGGTHADHLKWAPSKLMFSKVRDWAHESKQRIFHLGGGVGGKQDELFEFKASYSATVTPFSTLRLVVDSIAYANLLELRNKATNGAPSDPDFFPSYRQLS